jgi:hypothetical protein
LASTPIERSKPKPSPSDADEIVELRPPGDSFSSSVTAKYYAVEHAPLIAELLKRGYTKVDRDRG